MRIAITTPTGHIGRKVTRQLLEQGGHEVILLARNANKLKEEKKLGAIIHQGDLTDRKYVAKATQGVDTLFWVNPPNSETDNMTTYYRTLTENATNAIRQNSIPRTVFLSSLGAHQEQGLGPINALHECEQMFRETTDNLTILRPTFLMENFLPSLQTIRKDHNVYLPINGNARISMIATDDVALAAVNTLVNDFTGQKVVPLHGPRDYTFAEATDIIGQALGEKVNYVKISPDQAIDALTQTGMSDHVADLMVEMYEAIENGRMVSETPRTNQTTTPTTLEDFANRVIVNEYKTGK